MYIIFDLDGTISDSSPGIIQTFKLLFNSYKIPPPSDDKLKEYIGPPIEETLQKHFKKEDIEPAAKLYRKLYKEKGGIYKNSMYKGVDKLLKHLKQKKHKIYLATTKEVNLAKEILNNFGIFQFFDGVYGVNPKKNIYTKIDVLNELLKNHYIDKKDCIIIGDTMYDVNGGKAIGVRVGAALYGFSKKEVFQGENIEFFVNSVEQLYSAIDGLQRI